MKPKLTRRNWFRRCAAGGAVSLASAVPGARPMAASAVAPAVVGNSNMSVKSVEQMFIDLPFKPVPKRHQYREFNHEQRRLAAVLTHARWPAINLNHMFVSDMVKPGIKPANGSVAIPDTPGLGYELDEDALEKYRIERVPERPRPNKLYAILWPSGATSYYRNADEFRAEFVSGKLPVFPRGVYLEEVTDNGGGEWKQMHAKVQSGGVHVGGRPL